MAVPALERAKLLALRVREAFEARRRRESELSALFDAASDLATLRSVDSVLTAIVRRARQLLGTDTAYLTLNDDVRGGTCMRVADGSVSAWFQALRLPMGAGLGGLVAPRLDRVGRLLGRDWSTPDRALEVQLALRLHGLAALDPA